MCEFGKHRKMFWNEESLIISLPKEYEHLISVLSWKWVFVSVYHFKNNKMSMLLFFFHLCSLWQGVREKSTISERMTFMTLVSGRTRICPGIFQFKFLSSTEYILCDSFIWSFPRGKANVDTRNKTNTSLDLRQEGTFLSRRDHEESLGSSKNVLCLELRGWFYNRRHFSKLIKLYS